MKKNVIVIESDDTEELESKMNEAVNLGYEPWGNLSIVSVNGVPIRYVIVMMKRSKNTATYPLSSNQS